MVDKDFFTDKILQKIKDLSLDSRFENIPSSVSNEYWSVIMFVKGFTHYLNSIGYEIRKKD